MLEINLSLDAPGKPKTRSTSLQDLRSIRHRTRQHGIGMIGAQARELRKPMDGPHMKTTGGTINITLIGANQDKPYMRKNHQEKSTRTGTRKTGTRKTRKVNGSAGSIPPPDQVINMQTNPNKPGPPQKRRTVREETYPPKNGITRIKNTGTIKDHAKLSPQRPRHRQARKGVGGNKRTPHPMTRK